MSNLDELMDINPLDLTTDDPRIDERVLFYRRQRAQVASGKKPEKETGPKLTLEDLGIKKVAPKLAVRRL